MNLSRCKGTRVNGWQVRVERKGMRHYKLFSCSRYGGVRRAKHAAERYLASIRSLIPPWQATAPGVLDRTWARAGLADP